MKRMHKRLLYKIIGGILSFIDSSSINFYPVYCITCTLQWKGPAQYVVDEEILKKAVNHTISTLSKNKKADWLSLPF